MTVSKSQRVELLSKMALFHDLDESQIDQIAQRLVSFHVPAGDLLYEIGDRADNFYFVQDGEFLSAAANGSDPKVLSTLRSGDVFGERALLKGTTRAFTVSASKDGQLLYLPKQDFYWLISTHPSVNEKLNSRSEAKTLKREVDFDWLREDEIVHHLTRKHSAYLWMRLARPLIAAISAFLAFYTAINAPNADSQFRWFTIGAGLLFVAIAWILWEYFDWRNDFYILTNIRVVWLEHVLLRSSSRKEAPLGSIQQVNVHTSQLGRILGFGDVIVRTFTGTVLMPAVGSPHHVKQLIEEHIARSRQKSRSEKHSSIRRAVRQSLGRKSDETPESNPEPEMQAQMMDMGQRFQLFKTRHVDGDVVTYHRHWFVLFSSMLLPAFFLVAVIYILGTIYGASPPDSASWAIAIAFTLLPIVVMLYRYLDWRNDIYRVTAESLIDTEKKPLGSEITKSAPLANVLSLENHRVGLLGLLMNFGEVRINVGDTSLDFIDVHNPALIQQDIFVRMQVQKANQDLTHEADESARMAQWLKIYEQERTADQDSDS